MITCKETIEFLSDYLDGRLDEKTRAVFEQHLGICPDCVNYVESFRQTIELVKAGGDPPVPVKSELPPTLLKAILEARK